MYARYIETDLYEGFGDFFSKIKETFTGNLPSALEKSFKSENMNPKDFDTSYDEILKELNQDLIRQNAKLLNLNASMMNEGLKDFFMRIIGADWSDFKNICSSAAYDYLSAIGSRFLQTVNKSLERILLKNLDRKMAARIALRTVKFLFQMSVPKIKNLAKSY